MNSNANVMDTVENAIEPVQDSARTAARAGSQEFRNLIADVEELIKRVAHVDDADLARAREKLQKTLSAAKTAVHDGTERVKTTARHAADTTDQYVHQNPWSAIGIAAAAGAAIAVLLSTRMQR
jgi:ElaB/YqjD/DUF883 family membrane-anchored ribosome-binding protein